MRASSSQPSRSTTVDGIPDFFLEIGLALEIALLLLLPFAYYGDLPSFIDLEVIGMDQQVQASRGIVFLSSGLGGLVTLGLGLLARKPSYFFFPVSINSSNYRRQYRLAARFLRTWALLEAAIVLYCLQVILDARASIQEAPAPFNPWVPGLIMTLMIVVLLIYYRWSRKMA